MNLSIHRSGGRSRGFQTYRVPDGLNPTVIKDYLEALDCPRALSVWLLFSSGEHDQLTELEFDPNQYVDKDVLRNSYFATKFLSKFDGLTTSFDRDEVALSKFAKCELACGVVNKRFRNLSTDSLFKGPVVWLHNAVKRKIHRILGEFDLEEFLESPDWGPGASTLIKRRDASSQEKFQREAGITRDLYHLFPMAKLGEVYPHWASHLQDMGEAFPTFCVGNKVVTVPKDSSTNRVIAVEPGINLWFQKSIGDMIGRRLLRFGVDLKDQSRNQHLAYLGSKTSELATVDFSSASDTISTAVVEELLPLRWFVVMDASRSKYGLLHGKTQRWEKFSSMGNGFTFPLESLIFYACAKACVEYLHVDELPVSVFGDDVILPSSAMQLYTELVSFYGFRVNTKKSHHCGFFRESCGAHYYSGFDLKPVYFRTPLQRVESVYRLANAIRRLAFRQGSSLCCDVRFRTCWNRLVQQVPQGLRLRVPEGFGDGGFVCNFDEATPGRLRHGLEGFAFLQYSDVGRYRVMEEPGYLLAELWRLSKRAPRGPTNRHWLKAIAELTDTDVGIAGRNAVHLHVPRYQLCKSQCRQWPDLGPWLDLG